jgi:hypothetical protein
MKPYFLLALAFLTGCVSTPPAQWSPVTNSAEEEYQPYLARGTGTLTGQAFLTQRSGNTVKAAGHIVTLDPATSVGRECWAKAGGSWVKRSLTPPSPGFAKARLTTVADADGRFTFSNLAPGGYYVRTEAVWEIPGQLLPEGGLVGQLEEVHDGQTTTAILHDFAQ